MEKVEKVEWKNCEHLIQVFFTYLQEFLFGDAGFQNKFFYQPTSSMLQSKKRIKPLILLLVGNQKGYIVLFFLCKILFSNIA